MGKFVEILKSQVKEGKDSVQYSPVAAVCTLKLTL